MMQYESYFTESCLVQDSGVQVFVRLEIMSNIREFFSKIVYKKNFFIFNLQKREKWN